MRHHICRGISAAAQQQHKSTTIVQPVSDWLDGTDAEAPERCGTYRSQREALLFLIHDVNTTQSRGSQSYDCL